MRPFLLAVLCLVPLAAVAKPPPGIDPSSPIHAWFDRQHNIEAQNCCGYADGHELSDAQWRTDGSGYDVMIGGQWRKVPKTAKIQPGGGPNPTGHGVVWYTIGPGYLDIYCFAPGSLF